MNGLLLFLNSFIRKQVIVRIGKHLHLINSKTASSDAVLSILPNTTFRERKMLRLAASNERLKLCELTSAKQANFKIADLISPW
jgi:hypothetical protein